MKIIWSSNGSLTDPSLYHLWTIVLYFLIVPTFQPVATALDIDLQGMWNSISKIRANAKSSGCSVLNMECCCSPFVQSWHEVVASLRIILKEDFYGQHLAAETVVRSLESHLQDEDGSKALVLSFHGWAGSGKTFLSEQIMKAMYKKGVDSKFAKFYMASYHFPDSSTTKVAEYQEMLRQSIIETVRKCEKALFIFDEVDKTPEGVFDALVPFIQYPGKQLEGLNFKRSVFIFISNNGANDITRITLKAWQEGRNREELTFKDFEHFLSNEAFNKKGGGLYKSRIIDKILVDFFIPFLPMQREHVILCAEAEARRLGQTNIDTEKIADGLAFWPAVERLYSQTGCKKVESLVKYYVTVGEMEKDDSIKLDDNNESLNSKEEL